MVCKNPVFILAGLLGAASQIRCLSKKEKNDDKPVYTSTSPVRTDTELTREYVCQIRAIQHIELRALERGYLENIHVDEGQAIKKGQLMFEILPTLYRAELQKAEAEASFADI